MRLVDCIVDCFIDYTVDNVKNIHKFIKPAFDLVRVHTQMHVFSTVGFIALMFTLRRRKHTSLLVTVYKYKFTQDHDSVVHLVVHTPQGFDSVKHASGYCSPPSGAVPPRPLLESALLPMLNSVCSYKYLLDDYMYLQ